MKQRENPGTPGMNLHGALSHEQIDPASRLSNGRLFKQTIDSFDCLDVSDYDHEFTEACG